MPRGKVSHLDPPIKWRVNIPESIAAKVELMLLNPLTGDIRYGARSDLITKLLKQWLDERIGGAR